MGLKKGQVLENTETHERLVYQGKNKALKDYFDYSPALVTLEEYGDTGLWYRAIGVPGTFTPIENIREDDLWDE